jgi:hypothetical protein
MTAVPATDKAEARQDRDVRYFQLEDVPESISRADYQALITSLGFQLNDLKALEFAVDGVYAVVMARGPKGLLIDHVKNEIVTHKVFIPAVDKPSDELVQDSVGDVEHGEPRIVGEP